MNERNPEEIDELLERMLDQGPVGQLPYGFSRRLIRRLEAGRDRHIGWKGYLLAALIVIGGFGGSFCLLAMYNAHAARQFAGFILAYKWIFLFAFAGWLTLDYAEEKLIGYKIYHAERL